MARGAGTLLAVAAVVVACSTPNHPRAVPPTVRVTLENFKIDAPAQIKAGPVRFLAIGIGPSMHELNIVRSGLPVDGLPVALNGTVDDQKAHADFDHLGEVEGIDIGQHKSMTLDLQPGRYVLYCNMDGHYLAGMTAQLTVTA